MSLQYIDYHMCIYLLDFLRDKESVLVLHIV